MAMETPQPTEWDELVHSTIRSAIARAGAGAVTDVSFDFERSAGAWMTSVEPHRPDAASMYVIAEDDHELNLTVGRTWIELWGVDDPVEWLREMTEAAVDGRLEEAANSRIRVRTRVGVIGGGQWLVLPWRWHRLRRYAPYRQP